MKLELKKYDRISVLDYLSKLSQKIYQESNYEIVMLCTIVDELKKQTSFLSTCGDMNPEYLLSSFMRIIPDTKTDNDIMNLIKKIRKDYPNIHNDKHNYVEIKMDFDENKLN